MTNDSGIKEEFNEAMAEFNDNNYGRCVELFNQILEDSPDFTLGFMSRGSAWMKLDKIDDAVSDFTRVLQMDPNNARAYHLRGLAQERSGDLQAAVKDFDRALEINPEYGAAYFSRANIHTKMGHTDLASEDIEMVTHLTNKEIETFANENNVWRSQHLRLEEMEVADVFDR
jgi:tetratricopeptide (TPR) repeat protein